MTSIKTKIIAIVVFILLIVSIHYLYKKYSYEKSERQRVELNSQNLRKLDSVRFVKQILTDKELNEYLQYTNKSLSDSLVKLGIKKNKVIEIVSTKYIYKDTTTKSTDISNLIPSIKDNTKKISNWEDNSECLSLKGEVVYDNGKLNVTVKSKEFHNTTDAVVYEERRQWKFLFFKTRFLGKKQFTAKVFNSCGKSETVSIQVKK